MPEVRGRIFGAFELAEPTHEDSERDAWLTIAVLGSGPTSVQVAGQIVELSRRALKRDSRTFDPSRLASSCSTAPRGSSPASQSHFGAGRTAT